MGIPNENSFTAEQRATDRFPIENDVLYKMLAARKMLEARHIAQTGYGRTLNISSSGILFKAEAELPVGQRVELAVDWPAKLNEHCGLKLVAMGRIVRSSADAAAIQIEKYDFRTRAAAAVASGSD